MTAAAPTRRRFGVAAVLVVALAVGSCSTAGTPIAGSTSSTASAPVTPTVSSPTVSSPTVSAPITSTAPTAAATIGPVGLPGVNDPDCTSEFRPVVLLHGSFASVRSNYAAMSAGLQAAGRCVYGTDYGSNGVQPVRDSARSVTAFVDRVLATTGAGQVDVVAYSQGGLVLRTALRQDGLAPDVATAVLIAPTFHGTTSPLLSSLPAGVCPACSDQAAGSALLTELDAGSTGQDADLDGSVRYAVISSRSDVIVTPTASQVPLGPADRVRSLIVQDQCPDDYVDHVALPADPGVIGWTVAALDTDGAPDPGALTCR